MIPRAMITEWSNTAPWSDMQQVEQDLIISRCLSEIFGNNFLSSKLAFRGGTALHKLYLHPQTRYSEDIDLVQITAEPIGEILDEIKSALSFLEPPKTKRKQSNNVLLYTFDTTFPPITKRKLKVEINCKEHFTVNGYTHEPYSLEGSWYTGGCKITTYDFNELVGTKLRALYQRRKGRDLFDVYLAVISGRLDMEKTIECYRRYIAFPNHTIPSRKEYLLNLELKMLDADFRQDISPMLKAGFEYDIDKAYDICMNELFLLM